MRKECRGATGRGPGSAERVRWALLGEGLRGYGGGVLAANPGGCQDVGRSGGGGRGGGPGGGPGPPIPGAARMSAGLVLVAASAAIAIAIPAAAGVACGGTTSRITGSWAALVTPIVWPSRGRNQPTWTGRPSRPRGGERCP